MKKILVIIKLIFILAVICIVIKLLFLSSNIQESKYSDIHQVQKKHFGGIIYNFSKKNIKINDSTKMIDLPANMSSRDIGLFDADGFSVNSPTVFEGKKYTYGSIKICDCSTLKLIYDNKKKINIANPSISYQLCKLIDKVGWFKNIKSAFAADDK